MTRSGSVDFTQNETEIIEDAYGVLGILSEGESLTTKQKTDSRRDLNRMLKFWSTNGQNLWKYREGSLVLEKNTSSYLLGSTGGNATNSLTKTELSADAILGASSISVDSISGMSASDNIGIELDDDTVQWTTINGAPSGTTVNLSAVLTGATSENNNIYVYTNKITRPLKLTSARLKIDNGNEIPMTLLSHDDYFDLPNKTTTGQPTQFYYSPLLDNGKIYVLPTPSNSSNYLNFTYYPYIEDFDTALNNGDFPTEWLDVVVYNLAKKVGLREGVSMTQTYKDVALEADIMLEKALGFDREEDSTINFTPSNSPQNKGWV